MNSAKFIFRSLFPLLLTGALHNSARSEESDLPKIAPARQLIRVSPMAWQGLSPADQRAIQKNYIVSLADITSYGMIVDTDIVDTGGNLDINVKIDIANHGKRITTVDYSPPLQKPLTSPEANSPIAANQPAIKTPLPGKQPEVNQVIANKKPEPKTPSPAKPTTAAVAPPTKPPVATAPPQAKPPAVQSPAPAKQQDHKDQNSNNHSVAGDIGGDIFSSIFEGIFDALFDSLIDSAFHHAPATQDEPATSTDPATHQFLVTYTIKLDNGEYRQVQEVESNPLHYTAGSCVSLPEFVWYGAPNLCTQTPEILQNAYLQPADESGNNASPALPALSTTPPRSVKAGAEVSHVNCTLGNLEPVRTSAEKCALIEGSVVQ